LTPAPTSVSSIIHSSSALFPAQYIISHHITAPFTSIVPTPTHHAIISLPLPHCSYLPRGWCLDGGCHHYSIHGHIFVVFWVVFLLPAPFATHTLPPRNSRNT
jgi:hypothetical protein